MTDLIQVFDLAGTRYAELDNRQRWRLLEEWRRIYCRRLHEQTGKWVLHGLHWHIFSGGYAIAKHGARALELYLAEHPCRFFVVPESSSHPVFRCDGSVSDFSACGLDILVFSERPEWTMAFTHEQPALGPYYARAKWQV